MSHFTVMIIGDNIEKQLQPFQENNMDDCPREHLVFNDIEDKYRLKYETEGSEKIKLPNGELVNPYDDMFKKGGKGPLQIGAKTVIPETLEKITIPHKETYSTFGKFMKDYAGYTRDKINKRYGYWENPNAKWDWYEIGGRWTGYFKAKDKLQNINSVGRPGIMTLPAKPGWYDQILKGNIDVDGMRKDAYDKAVCKYEIVEQLFGGTIPKLEIRWKDMFEGSPYEKIDNDERRKIYWNQPGMVQLQALRDEVWKNKSGRRSNEDESIIIWMEMDDYQCTKEEYGKRAQDNCLPSFAIIKEGKWYQKGQMGWWACVSNEKEDDTWHNEFNAMFDSLPDDTLITIVDCHI